MTLKAIFILISSVVMWMMTIMFANMLNAAGHGTLGLLVLFCGFANIVTAIRYLYESFDKKSDK